MKAKDITYLDFSLQDKMCITCVGETKNSAKLFHSEIANVSNFELGGLAHDRGQRGVMSMWCSNAGTDRRTWVPISSSTTSILSAMTGGLGPLLRAALSISIASAWNWSEKRGHSNEKDIAEGLSRLWGSHGNEEDEISSYLTAIVVVSASSHEGVRERGCCVTGTNGKARPRTVFFRSVSAYTCQSARYPSELNS